MNPIMLPGEIQSTVADGNLVRNSKNRYLPENYHIQNKDEIYFIKWSVFGDVLIFFWVGKFEDEFFFKASRLGKHLTVPVATMGQVLRISSDCCIEFL